MKWFLSRILPLFVGLLLEMLVVVGIFSNLIQNVAWFEGVLRIISFFLVLYIIRNSRHLSSDLMWILLIMLFPVAGSVLFLFLGADLLRSKMTKGIVRENQYIKTITPRDEEILDEIDAQNPYVSDQFRYLMNEGYPVCHNQGYTYYGSGEVGWPVMLAEMKKAKKYIFLEYFIIEEGTMWNEMLNILKEKAKEGVECRVMYDDLGSYKTISAHYGKELQKFGIKAVTFNKISPMINIMMNHRDHRKIMVIDGKVAFTGGVNLADEYINKKVRFGYWKDTVVRIQGKAVDNLLRLFLTNWNTIRKEDTDYTKYYGEHTEAVVPGYVCAYGESPFTDEKVAQNVYLNLINQAKDYVYILTPYLIIDSDFINALILAAKRGIDVRIVTPGIPDKKMVFGVTRSYYQILLNGGVKIYEYTPGFDHAKIVVADNIVASVGTINLDYRSLYLHFENGTYLYGCDEVLHVVKDVKDAIAVSHEVTKQEARQNVLKSSIWSFIRIFAPMM